MIISTLFLIDGSIPFILDYTIPLKHDTTSSHYRDYCFCLGFCKVFHCNLLLVLKLL